MEAAGIVSLTYLVDSAAVSSAEQLAGVSWNRSAWFTGQSTRAGSGWGFGAAGSSC